MKTLIDYLRDPAVDKLNLDCDDRLSAHRKILAKKRMLKEVFEEFHLAFRRLDEEYFTASGMRIELGAGVAPIRDSFPDVLATDVVHDPNLDQELDAEHMHLDDHSVRALYGQNCFHHFPHPENFFSEADRVLSPGGGIILLEPYYGSFASFLYKRLFNTESFDKTFPSWETPIAGPMHGANQALSYIVFIRDRKSFETKFPTLRIVHHELCRNQLKYLLSGGLNFRQLAPDWSVPAVNLLQRLLLPVNHWLSLHHVIVVRKQKR